MLRSYLIVLFVKTLYQILSYNILNYATFEASFFNSLLKARSVLISPGAGLLVSLMFCNAFISGRNLFSSSRVLAFFAGNVVAGELKLS